jgi:hypothetical protein
VEAVVVVLVVEAVVVLVVDEVRQVVLHQLKILLRS